MPVGVAAATTSWISFSILETALTVNSVMLEWWAGVAADLSLHTASSSAFACNDFSLLLGSTSRITSGTFYGSLGVNQGLLF